MTEIISSDQVNIQICKEFERLKKYGLKCNCTDCAGERLNGGCNFEREIFNIKNKEGLFDKLESYYCNVEECIFCFFANLKKNKLD